HSPRVSLPPHAPTTVTPSPSLHDALPISSLAIRSGAPERSENEPAARRRKKGRRTASSPPCESGPTGFANRPSAVRGAGPSADADRKSTRLNSSHVKISYAVFCLKKKRRP